MKTNLSPAKNGFSIFELLVVIVVIALMLALVVPTLNSVSIGMSITRGGDDFASLLKTARMKAITESKAVEVRFYNLAEEFSEDDQLVNVVQIATQDDEGFYRSSNPVWLPAGVGISRDRRMSTLDSDFLLRGRAEDALALDPDATFVGFRFKPDGSAELPSNSKWFFTIVHHSVPEKGTIPDNFYTVQIDPVIGQIRVLRP